MKRTKPLTCWTSVTLPDGITVTCAGRATETCTACERRFCAECLAPVGLCEDCAAKLDGVMEGVA